MWGWRRLFSVLGLAHISAESVQVLVALVCLLLILLVPHSRGGIFKRAIFLRDDRIGIVVTNILVLDVDARDGEVV